MATKTTEMTAFEQKNLAAFKQLRELTNAKKSLEEQEKKIKDDLTFAMELNGITSIDNDYVIISHVAETESVALDTKAFRQDDPDLYNEVMNKYNKRTKKKACVRITVK
nr:MAG TPA: hypothetical protein [Caudoviricetes sp.]